MSELKTFLVTITDVVDCRATVRAASKADAHNQAWEWFRSGEHSLHFIEHSETTTDVEELQPRPAAAPGS